MNNSLVTFVMIAVFVALAIGRRGKRRTIVGTRAASRARELPMTASVPREPPEPIWTTVEDEAPDAVEAPAPIDSPRYLLGGRAARTTAMLGMMSGPGLCTPRVPKPQ